MGFGQCLAQVAALGEEGCEEGCCGEGWVEVQGGKEGREEIGDGEDGLGVGG